MHTEPLEPRVLFTTIDTSTVALYTPTGAPATLAANRDAWLVIHGLNSSKDDSSMQDLATAIGAASPSDQVLLIDWSDLSHATDNPTAVRDAWAAADAIAAKVRAAGLRGSRINLMPFSMGGELADRLARDLGGVNRIVAIDPAAPEIALDMQGNPVSGLVHFARDSRYSIAFYGASYVQASLSADDAIELTNLAGTQIERHVQSLYVVTTMMRRDAGLESAPEDQISPRFSPANILAGRVPRWRKNSYDGGYEAKLSSGITPGSSPEEFEPLLLTYRDRHGRTVTLS